MWVYWSYGRPQVGEDHPFTGNDPFVFPCQLLDLLIRLFFLETPGFRGPTYGFPPLWLERPSDFLSGKKLMLRLDVEYYDSMKVFVVRCIYGVLILRSTFLPNESYKSKRNKGDTHPNDVLNRRTDGLKPITNKRLFVAFCLLFFVSEFNTWTGTILCLLSSIVDLLSFDGQGSLFN